MTFRAHLLISLFLLLFSCSNPDRLPPASALDAYLIQRSPRLLSVTDNIIFRFQNKYAINPTKESVKGVQISPYVDGLFYWDNSNTLIFKPANRLEYGQKYTIQFDLPILLGRPDIEDTKITWTCNTRRADFVVSHDGLQIDVENGSKSIILNGTLTTSDYVDAKIAASLLTVTLDNTEGLSPQWVHDKDGQHHTFSVLLSDIPEGAKEIYIDWDGSILGIQNRSRQTLVLPKGDSFDIVAIDHFEDPSRGIRITFSQPLDPSQHLAGLLSLDGSIQDIKTDIRGNRIWLYPPPDIHRALTLGISDKILSYTGHDLKKSMEYQVKWEMINPAVKALGSGVIIPNSASVIFPFEAVNLAAVDIEIFKIYGNNMLQFLQENDLSGDYYLENVGTIIHQERIDLRLLRDNLKLNEWIPYGIDIGDYIKKEDGALYSVRVGFRPSYSQLTCQPNAEENGLALSNTDDDIPVSIMQYPYDYEGYTYAHMDDPCYPAYYHAGRFVSRNVLASPLGIIAKKELDNAYFFAITDLRNTIPVDRARIQLYDRQQQLLAEITTSRDGFALIRADKPAAFAVVNHDRDYGYLKLNDNYSNSLSDFDVGGRERPENMDGFIFTDRGVYRPGDTMLVHFMLDDTSNPLPQDHPVRMRLFDPKGNIRYNQVLYQHVDKLYRFDIAGRSDDLTGLWRAEVEVGASHFQKTIRVETIKPNRLKINLAADDPILYDTPRSRRIALTSQWLHGSPAAGLKVKSQLVYSSVSPDFKAYSSYTFQDPARKVDGSEQVLFDGLLDDQGRASMEISFGQPMDFPAMLRAEVKTRVFEAGGNFSEDYSAFRISPYTVYAGLRLPQNRWGYKEMKIDDPARLSFITLDTHGRPVPGRQVSIGIYDIDWQWWYYEGERHNIYKFNAADHREAIFKTTGTTGSDGANIVNLDLSSFSPGRKLVRICDQESGHCTGDFFYISAWAQEADISERQGLTRLSLVSDKAAYETGEEIKLTIPSEANTRILLTLEDDRDVLLQDWIDGQENQTEYRFKTNSSMGPSLYAHVLLIQPYATKNTDLPLRMYGILPLKIEDKSKKLLPQITMPEAIRPGESFELKVHESNGRSMAYTLMIVDEGLLDLTHFKTPDPYNHFYSKRSLGVKTWDIYDQVLSGFDGKVDKILSIGGDGSDIDEPGAKKAIRFKPVVLSAGPFHLNPGSSGNHTFTMPNYIGSVRAMVVARNGPAYGSAEKAVAVKSPLMLFPTLPRVIGPGEEVSIPVHLFYNGTSPVNVELSLGIEGPVDIQNASRKTVHFEGSGEKIMYFSTRIKDQTGQAHFHFEAKAGKERSVQEIEIEVRNPNPSESRVVDRVIDPGQSWDKSYALFGIPGSHEGVLEISKIPSMNLDDRMKYLTAYPYGCLEQTTSAVFPQLYLTKLTNLTEQEETNLVSHVQAGINRILSMQTTTGGFAGWPGSLEVDSWSTSYAGHFLLEAAMKSYPVPETALSRWKSYILAQCRNFVPDQYSGPDQLRQNYLEQAYRLYTLALAGDPALPSMNVLRMDKKLPHTAVYLLAGAYALSGNKSIAEKMIRLTPAEVKPYQEFSGTYGSALRDMSLICRMMLHLGQRDAASELVKMIATRMSSEQWYSTQTTSQALLAVSAFLEGYDRDKLRFSIRRGPGKAHEVIFDKPLYLYSFNPDEIKGQTMTIENLSGEPLFVRSIIRGQPRSIDAIGAREQSNHMRVTVDYLDENGRKIDVTTLPRGTDFVARVQIKNLYTRGPTIDQVALTQIFPSGWEIISGRLDDQISGQRSDRPTYQDIRDDRVHTFFNLRDEAVFTISLSASYEGSFILPPVRCTAMYDESVTSSTSGQMVRVEKPADL